VTLQDLGDLGDFVGGVLLVVSLLYLAFQIRQNTIAQRVAAVQASVGAANDLSRALNLELARRGLIPEGICEAYEANLRPFLDSPSGRLWWSGNASHFDAEFRGHLDARLAAWARTTPAE